MLFQEFGDGLGVLNVAVHAQAERLETLNGEKAVEWRLGGAVVAQNLDTRLGDESRQPGGRQVGIDQPMVGWIGQGKVGEKGIVPIKFTSIHNGAAEAGAVAADELGGGMGDDMRAPFERAEQVRGGESVIDHQRDVVLPGNFSNLLEGEDGDIRIAERLSVDYFGVGADGRAQNPPDRSGQRR